MRSRTEPLAVDASLAFDGGTKKRLRTRKDPLDGAFADVCKMACETLEAPILIAQLGVDSAHDKILAHCGFFGRQNDERLKSRALESCRDAWSTEQETFRIKPAVERPKGDDIVQLGGLNCFGGFFGENGVICALGRASRHWSDVNEAFMRHLIACATRELALCARISIEHQVTEAVTASYQRLARYSGLRDEISTAFMAENRSVETRFGDLLRVSCLALGFDRAIFAKVNCGDATIKASFPPKTGQPEVARSISGSLAGFVVTSTAICLWSEPSARVLAERPDLLGNFPGSYVGIPLFVSGVLYGIIEFSSDTPMRELWCDEEETIFGVISMLACANIEMLIRAEQMRDSEIDYLSLLRNQLELIR